jgi:hypothetical protein
MQDYTSKLEHTSKFSMMGEWMSTMVAWASYKVLIFPDALFFSVTTLPPQLQ